MRANLILLLIGLALFGAGRFVNAAYNEPSCGTARVCGAPLHDFLHRVVGR